MGLPIAPMGRTVTMFVERYGVQLAEAGIKDMTVIGRMATAERVMSLADKAVQTGRASSVRHLVNFVNKTGDEELKILTQFRQVATSEAAVMESCPKFAKNSEYINGLINHRRVSNVPGLNYNDLNAGKVIDEVIASTEKSHPMHKLAASLVKGSEVSGMDLTKKALAYSASNQGPSILLETMSSSHDVTVRLASVASESMTHGQVTAKGVIAFANYFKSLPGVSSNALRILAKTEAATANAVKNLETTTNPGSVARFFGEKPVTTVHWDKTVDIVNEYRSAFATIAKSPLENAKTVFAQKEELLQSLLKNKISSGSWKVFSSETWHNATQNGKVSFSGGISGGTSTHIERSLFEKQINSVTSGSFSGNAIENSASSIRSSVNLPVANTGVFAPQLSPATVLKHEGDLILESGGKLHTINRADHEAWFKIAEREMLHH